MTRRPAPKGWCPSSLRPMESGDGYIVRIKPAFGRVTRTQLEKIAHLADQFGNGIIELTNRANLQLRGVSMADHPALIDALVQAGLVDMDPDLDAAPQILVAPNCDADTRMLYDNLRRAKLPNLPAKFGMVLEQGGQMLMQASGDIRLCALGDKVVVWADGCRWRSLFAICGCCGSCRKIGHVVCATWRCRSSAHVTGFKGGPISSRMVCRSIAPSNKGIQWRNICRFVWANDIRWIDVLCTTCWIR